MKIEHADQSRTGVTVPTRSEFAEAERRGVIFTGDLIQQMRAEARTNKRTLAAPIKSAVPEATTADTSEVKKLKRQVLSLQTENTRLKIRILTGR